MLMRGQAPPSGMVAGSEMLASVHGHPVLPGGGGGSSFRLGQRIRRFVRVFSQTPKIRRDLSSLHR